MSKEIARFKEWAPEHEGAYGEWECDYEHWPELWDAVKNAMKSWEMESHENITSNDLLYAIARDNEVEILRKELLKYPALLRHLATFGVTSSERDAKWQIAVSVAEAKLPDAADLIRPYVTDSEEYVRRRSLLAMAPFAPIETEKIAKDCMAEDYEYSRIAGIHVLDIVNSESLSFYLERHANDPSQYVRSNVEQIKSKRKNA